MANAKLSTDEIKLREFLQSTCKFAPREDVSSTSILLRKGPLSVNSVSDITTLEYLENFRRRIGYQEKLEDEIKPIQPIELEKVVVCEEAEIFRDDETYKEWKETTIIKHHLTAQQLDDQIVLDEFWSLKTVDISNNELKSVRNLGAMPYLQTINASQNLLETFLDITAPAPASLKEVDFSHNKISNIVELVGYWSLTHINLSHNELKTVQGFSGLNYLQVLDLSHNKIETLINIECPNLISLHLNSNNLESITEYIGCPNLRYLNLHKNKLSIVQGLKYLTELTELNVTENNIEDITELEHLKPLLNLTRLKIHPNPISSMDNWRLVIVHGLRQILWLDEIFVEPSELRAAANLFIPSFKKLAYLDHIEILLQRAYQSANANFDSYCRSLPSTPILLIVGPPQSHCHTLALLLKEKFRNKVHLGGMHSTATTIEGSHPKLDIPVSYESFKEMKNKGEFLSTCQILGRICGFATSQITRAAEKAALLVAAVPLNTALALREWNLNPKLILALPSVPPEFPIDEERIETIRRSIELDSTVEGLFPKRRSSQVEQNPETTINENQGKDHHHLVNFAEMLSVVPSTTEEKDNKKYEDEGDFIANEARQHSILKTPRFEVDDTMNNEDELEDNELNPESAEPDESLLGIPENRTSNSKVRISPRISDHFEQDPVLDMEKKKRGRLKSLAPGMERYSIYDSNAMTDEDDEYLDDVTDIEDPEEWADKETGLRVDTANGETKQVVKQDQTHKPIVVETTAESRKSFFGVGNIAEGNVPASLIYGNKRLDRLASLLILADQRTIPSLKIPDIVMNLSSPENRLDPKLFQPAEIPKVPSLPKAEELPLEPFELADEFLDEDREEGEHESEEEYFEAVVSQPDNSKPADKIKPVEEVPAEQPLVVEEKAQIPSKMENLTGGLCTPFQWPGFDLYPTIENLENKFHSDAGVDVQRQENEDRLKSTLKVNQTQVDANVVPNRTDETRVPEVMSNTQTPEELLHSSLVASREDTTTAEDSVFDEPKSTKKQKKKGLRFQKSIDATNSIVEGLAEEKAADTANEPSQADELPSLQEGMDGERVESGKQRKSMAEKIMEPVHLTESEHSQPDEYEEHRHHLLTHQEAMTFSIFHTKEMYSKFHAENPGFFHATIDTADLCECYQILENIAMDALLKFKQESGVSMNKPQGMRSHAGVNQIDANYFLADRIQKMKDSSVLWIRGREKRNSPIEMQASPLNSNIEQSEVLLTKPACPRNLLDPTIHRPPITFKMKKLVELQERKAKCLNFESKSCSLPLV